MLYKITVNIPTLTELRSTWSSFIHHLDTSLLRLETHIYTKHGLGFWKLMLTLTGHCGPREYRHWPLYGNPKGLWLRKTKYYYCKVCGAKEPISGSLRARNTTYSRDGRYEDIKQLQQSLKTATNEAERTAVKKALHKITHEEKRTRDMREDLIKATRNHDHNQIKDIHEYVAGKKALRND